MKKPINITWAYIGGLILGVIFVVYIFSSEKNSKSEKNNLAAAFCSEVNSRFAHDNDPIYTSTSCEPIDLSYVDIKYKLRPNTDRNQMKLNFKNEMANDSRLKLICQNRLEGKSSELFKNFKINYSVYDNNDEFLVSYEFDTSKCITEEHAAKQSQ